MSDCVSWESQDTWLLGTFIRNIRQYIEALTFTYKQIQVSFCAIYNVLVLCKVYEKGGNILLQDFENN